MILQPPTFSLSHHGPVTRIELISANSYTGEPTQVCAFRIGDTLIDTGSPLTQPAMLEYISQHPPRRIILTHQHEDHMGGVAAICRQCGDMPVFCPEAHVQIIATTDKVPEYRAVHWGHPEPYANLIPFAEGDEFIEGDCSIKAILTPGHTVGHMAFLVSCHNEHLVLSGDLYLGPTCFMAFGECNVPDFITSLDKLIAIPHDYTGLPSHGGALNEPKRYFSELKDWYLRETELSLEAAEKLGSTDYVEVFRVRFGKMKMVEIFSRGEVSRLAHLRGIFEPVSALPAPPVRLPV
jgi:glyoxylase-like metal-dependent hydrolase (beta-lactamase superfamily II)